MKENNKLKIISIIMMLICIVSIGYTFLYFNKNDDKNMNFSVAKNNINKSDEEIALGDTCSTSCSAWSEGTWGSWTCSPGGSNTSSPSSSLSTSVTSYTQNDNITNTQGCNSKGLKNCSSCHSEKKWTRSCSYTCSSCSAGKYLGTDKLCHDCSAGYYNGKDDATTSCTKCTAGYYSSSAGSSSCTKCKAGTYNNQDGSTGCSNCAAGTYSGSDGATSCSNCSAGTYSSAGASSCTNCSAGTYSSSAGSSSCTKCSAGYYSSAGASSCTQCSAGSYSSSEGSSSCTKCAAGKYQNEKGQTSCKDCPEGTVSSSDRTRCVCAAGYFQNTSGKCEKCPKGYKCVDSIKTSCKETRTGYQDEEGQSTCKKCKSPNAHNADGTGCVLGPVDTISGDASSTNYYFAKNEKRLEPIFKATYDYGFIKKVTLENATWKVESGENYTINNGKLSFSGSYSGGGNYKSFPFKISASTIGNSTTSTKIPTSSGSFNIYKCDWSSTDLTDTVYKNPKPLKAIAAVAAGCDFFEGGNLFANLTGTATGYKYTKFWSRCCHTPPPSDFGGCYGDEPYLGVANKVAWNVYDAPFKKDGYNLKYRYDDIKDAGACVELAKGHTCTRGNLDPTQQTIDAKGCESEDTKTPSNMTPVNMEIKSKIEDCSYTENGANKSFYTINCTRKINVGFDYNGNGVVDTIKETFRGLGIKFNVDVNTKVECNATFDSQVWQDSYKLVMKRLANVKSRKNPSFTKTAETAYVESRQKNSGKIWDDYISKLSSYDNIKKDDYTKETINYLYEQYNLAKTIEAIISTYNSYKDKLKLDLNEDLTLKLDYELNKEKNSETKYEGKEIANTEKLTVDNNTIDGYIASLTWITYPKNYSWEQNRVVKMSPENLYVEKGGEITKTSTTISGGNKVYVDYFITIPQKVKLDISVNNLGGNGSIVKNNKCEINILKDDIKYRQVDVKNPFINADWKKGENWVNKEFDFTKAIDSATWNKKSKVSIELKAKEVSALQASNASYIKSNSSYKPYLGVCEENVNLSNVEKKICNQISKSIK